MYGFPWLNAQVDDNHQVESEAVGEVVDPDALADARSAGSISSWVVQDRVCSVYSALFSAADLLPLPFTSFDSMLMISSAGNLPWWQLQSSEMYTQFRGERASELRKGTQDLCHKSRQAVALCEKLP